jgi:membrane protease YdiL (CAAX protease family)
MALALGIVLRLVHKRGLFSIIGPWPAFTRQFLSTARVLLVLYVVFYFADMVLPQSDGLEYLPKLSLRDWLLLLPLTLPALLIQTGTEELVFRGYLQSQLAARFSQTWVWLLVPSILFGVLHFDATWGPAFGWALVIWAVGFGLVAADLTARSGTLGPAIAMHLINNFQGIALVAPEDSFDGLALYAYRFPAESDLGILLWLSVNLMVLVCYWLAARLALRC